MLFGAYLVRRGLISPIQFLEAVELQQASRLPLGELALKERALTVRQVFAVLAEQSQILRPFGRVAVELGFMTEGQLAQLLALQNTHTQSIQLVLVDMGALDEETMHAQLEQYYRHQADPRELATPVALHCE